MPTLALYAGSFDPPTNGHLWMIGQGAALFERLTVAVGVNPAKRAAYPLEQRLAWLREICAPFHNVEVASFGNLFLARYAADAGARHILRGLRSEADFTYEQTMRHINADLAPAITTVFLVPPRELCEVSSSLVRGLIGPEGWRNIVRRYVPDWVFRTLVLSHA
jgi:pantetheine-phosphate adenylyltransferase